MPTLEYSDQGRSGHVIYTDHSSSLQFYYESGGGNCVAVISIPSVTQWEKETKRTITERDSIITFVAEQATKDQVRNGYYILKESFIEIYTK